MTRNALAAAVTLLVAFSPSISDACSCAWGGPFLTVAPRAESIVRGRVLRYTGPNGAVGQVAMDVETVEVLKGRERPGRIRVWGDNGIQCRPYVSTFPVGTEWVFAISRIAQGEGAGDFVINGCGQYWVRVEGDLVVGQLLARQPPGAKDAPERMPLSELRARLR
jgi:hypothetical protein